MSHIWVGDLHINDINQGKACHLNLHIYNRFAKEANSPLCQLLEK